MEDSIPSIQPVLAQDLAERLVRFLEPIAKMRGPGGAWVAGQTREPGPLLDDPARAALQVPRAVKNGRKEHFLAFYLNSRNQLIDSEMISIGTLSASLVHPREVFGPAIQSSAASLIVAHNHPSGDCAPSAEDRSATQRLKASGELLGIPLLDHLIVSRSGFFSFRENGLLA